MTGSERHPSDDAAGLPIQSLTTEGPEGGQVLKHTVHCPREGASVSLAHCEACPRYVRAGPDGRLWCRHGVPEEARVPLSAQQSLEGLLEATPIREVMTRDVTCLDSELLLREAAEILEHHGLKGAPVVEDQGILIGILSMTDLVQGHGRDRGEEGDGRDDAAFGDFTNRLGAVVEDAMTTQLASLPENASVGDAVRLMASASVRRLPVVNAEGVVVGIFGSTDLIRWLSARLKPSR